MTCKTGKKCPTVRPCGFNIFKTLCSETAGTTSVKFKMYIYAYSTGLRTKLLGSENLKFGCAAPERRPTPTGLLISSDGKYVMYCNVM